MTPEFDTSHTTKDDSREVRTVAVLGLGEAGTALITGLCSSGGWCAANDQRQVIGVDINLGDGPRGSAMAERIKALGIPAFAQYTQDLSDADLVISVVTGVNAPHAARQAAGWLKPGTIYADFNSITGPQTRAVADELVSTDVQFADVAVMGAYMATGMATPLLASGPAAPRFLEFAVAAGIPARYQSARIGDASAIKILRSVLIKGLEALSVECLVAARRQGLVDAVLDNLADVDDVGFANMVQVLAISHLVHAKRRMEEVEKAIVNLGETGVPALMSDATRRSHLRTVDAQFAADAVSGLDLEAALKLLDERVVTRAGKGPADPAA